MPSAWTASVSSRRLPAPRSRGLVALTADAWRAGRSRFLVNLVGWPLGAAVCVWLLSAFEEVAAVGLMVVLGLVTESAHRVDDGSGELRWWQEVLLWIDDADDGDGSDD
jgi:hypothetical protein